MVMLKIIPTNFYDFIKLKKWIERESPYYIEFGRINSIKETQDYIIIKCKKGEIKINKINGELYITHYEYVFRFL